MIFRVVRWAGSAFTFDRFHKPTAPATRLSGTDPTTEATREADAFLATILNGSSEPYPTPARVGNHRAVLDSWENCIERPFTWIDAGPSPSPTPGVVVQWFSSADHSSNQVPIRSPSLYPDYVASSPSHVSNSIQSSDNDSPPSVPSTVPEVDAEREGDTTDEGNVESSMVTKQMVRGALW